MSGTQLLIVSEDDRLLDHFLDQLLDRWSIEIMLIDFAKTNCFKEKGFGLGERWENHQSHPTKIIRARA